MPTNDQILTAVKDSVAAIVALEISTLTLYVTKELTKDRDRIRDLEYACHTQTKDTQDINARLNKKPSVAPAPGVSVAQRVRQGMFWGAGIGTLTYTVLSLAGIV